MAADGRDAFFRGRRVRRRQLRAREAVLPAAVYPRLPDIPADMAERFIAHTAYRRATAPFERSRRPSADVDPI